MNEPNENTRYFINNYGVFFTGQILEQYCYGSNCKNLYYMQDVEIISFFRKKRKNKFGFEFYFRYRELGKRQIWSLKCDELGKRFKIKRSFK